MNSEKKDLTTDKIKLIYEFNNSSPLFARVAASEMERANILDAINILENGMKIHPNYTTPYFILALANAYAGKEEEAKNSALQGSELLGSSETLDYYLSKIDKIIAERNSLSDAKRHAFFHESEENKSSDNTFDDLENKLDILAERLSKAKIIPKDMGEPFSELQHSEVPTKKIISETMAEIYFTQKNYNEAISIYEELMLQKPEKIDLYENKINDIKSLMK